MKLLPPVPSDRPSAVIWVTEHLGHLSHDTPRASPAFVGGQRAADDALEALDIDGYARRRSMVHPPSARGATKLSPYIRHGLLDLPAVWARVNDAPDYDRFRYQGELLWQEYSRHWYALFGTATRHPITHQPPKATVAWEHPPWWRDMACIDATVEELERDGWAVNQTRMWLAGQYSLRGHGDPAVGESEMFRHLLDGSRAANRMGWQWAAGTSRPRAYNFAKRQVAKRAPAFCDRCKLSNDCPIRAYAKPQPRQRVASPEPTSVAAAFGPLTPKTSGADASVVWLTAESLGVDDPALAGHPELPALFVFDEPLLQRLQLSGKRLIFLAETLAELQRRRQVDVYLGDPSEVLEPLNVVSTFAPVPGFGVRRAAARSASVQPWRWLRPPTSALQEHLVQNQSMPSFKDWCQLTKPQRSDHFLSDLEREHEPHRPGGSSQITHG